MPGSSSATTWACGVPHAPALHSTSLGVVDMSHAVEVDDPGVLIDIDTEADLQQARAGVAGGA